VYDATGAAFASFEQKWLVAYPENALAAVFLPVERRRREKVFGTLVHELEQAAFDVREPQVAAAKLAWWQQELAAAAAGNARHPVSKFLFADAQTSAVDPAIWPAMAAGASMLIEPSSCATLAESLAAFAPFHAAVARAEHALFAGSAGGSAADARLWTISHLLRVLATTPNGGASLPLDLLARHGATRAVLSTATPLRADLLRDYLAALADEIRAALALAMPASLNRRVRTALDLYIVKAAQRATDPLACLMAHTPPGRWRSLLTAWCQARAMTAQV
jgi:phytoene synthase